MEPLVFKSRKVSSFMFTGTINNKVNIDVIFDHLPLDNVVLGMKCNNKYKGDIKPTSCFFNQINLNTYLEDHGVKINLKIFSTGSFQIAGAKSEEQVKTLMICIINRLNKIRGSKTVKIVRKNGFLLDYKDYNDFSNTEKERFKNIKIYKKDGKVLGYKNGKAIFFGDTEIVFDKEFNMLIDIVRNSFVKNVYNHNGEKIGIIQFELVSNKNLKRIQMNKNLIIEKISDTEIHYYKIFYKNREKIKTLYIKKLLILDEHPDDKGIDDQEIDLVTKFNVTKDVLTENDIKIKLSNMNDIFYFSKDDQYYLDNDLFISLCEQNHSLKIYRNNTSIKLNVLTIKLYLDKDLKTIVDKKDYHYKFSILYYSLYDKIVISGLQNFNHVKLIEKFILDIINGVRNDVFVKIKNFKKNEEYQKIDLKSLL